jgi:hypothetical protein
MREAQIDCQRQDVHGGLVGVSFLARTAGEVLVVGTRQRELGLEIAGRGLNGEKHGGGRNKKTSRAAAVTISTIVRDGTRLFQLNVHVWTAPRMQF